MIYFDLNTRTFAINQGDYDRLDDIEVANQLAQDKDILRRPDHYKKVYIRSGKISGGITGGLLGAGAGFTGSQLIKNPIGKGVAIATSTGAGIYGGIKLGKKSGLNNYKRRVELAKLDRTLRERQVRDAQVRRRVEEEERRERLREERDREERDKYRREREDYYRNK